MHNITVIYGTAKFLNQKAVSVLENNWKHGIQRQVLVHI